jgi:hypothetical protein
MSSLSRVLYLSIWSGKHVNTPYHYILESDTYLDECIDFINANKFDTIIIYNLVQITNSRNATSLLPKLSDTISKLRGCGVRSIGFAVGGLKCMKAISSFCDKYNVVPDVFVTEYEFWNGGVYSYSEYISILQQLKQYTTTIKPQPKVCAYIGNVKRNSENPRQLLQEISNYIDAFFIEAYTTEPSSTTRKLQRRSKDLPANLDVYVICSLEGKGFSASTEHFLGDYVLDKSQRLDELEHNILLPLQPECNIKGFVYYSYAYAHYHLKMSKKID